MAGATDSRHFTRICDHVFRFAPFAMNAAQRQAIHSYDEHLGVDAYLAGIEWYRLLLESLPGGRD
jgi:carboxypeptidase PM20D1